MKRLFALVLAVLTVVALAACTEKNEAGTDATEKPADKSTEVTEPDGDVIDGGYSSAQSPVITDAVRALVAKAAQDLDGADYTPVAYLSSQVVAGTNHLILCKVKPVVPNASSVYALVTIYEDLEGNAEITAVQKSAVSAPEPYDPEHPVAGGYGEPLSPEVTDAAKAALEKASESLTDVGYKPVALLATQVVAGMNYQMLCRAVDASSGAELYYAIVTVYADLDQGAEITGVSGFGTAES